MHNAFAMVFGIAELALIAHAVRIQRDTLAHDSASKPVAFIGAAIGKCDFAKTVRFAF